MISVVIPTLDDEARLAPTLAALVAAAVDGIVREVVVADGGSTDATLAIADDAGARVVPAQPDLGRRLAAGCAVTRSEWLLVLPPGVRMERGWEAVADAHMTAHPARAGYFHAVLEGKGVWLRERLTGLRVAMSGQPYLEQGLLISRKLYDEVGGYRPKEEPQDLAARLGRRRLSALKARVFVPQG
ncbi:MAG: hypothetical protein JWP35_3922 [Caulobacter sp.]|nr:hypothetical protein [Caulobacter sp.]